MLILKINKLILIINKIKLKKVKFYHKLSYLIFYVSIFCFYNKIIYKKLCFSLN